MRILAAALCLVAPLLACGGGESEAPRSITEIEEAEGIMAPTQQAPAPTPPSVASPEAAEENMG